VPELNLESLPIDAHIDRIVALVRERRAVVITAAPGAGKTTRVPPALIEDGPVMLLQPRRVAARAIARRIAAERGWTVGQEVGWQVRFERRFQSDTRLLVATEGVLTARLQQDPLLSGFQTIVIDEFHERSLHADLGLALARQAWRARSDLRLVVMSATLDTARLSAYLDDCPIVEAPGRLHPIEITYRPGVSVDEAIALVWPQAAGALLCFLPGAPEIRRASERLQARRELNGTQILALHGGLAADEQDAALRPSGSRRVILATNIAETTLTVPDVTGVVDSGLQKTARYDAERAIDSLEIERISQDSADQRAGRAGRLRPGFAVRLWDERDRLRRHTEPEITRVDLASTCLAILSWGGDPRTLEWFESPPPAAVDAALALLVRLGATDDHGAITDLGRDLQHLPLHPRLGRMLIAASGAPQAARACALLSDRHVVPPRVGATSCDLLSVVDRDDTLAPHVLRVARDIRDSYRNATGRRPADDISDADFRRAVLAAYPDRVAWRRQPKSDRLLMASGTGARLARESGVHDAEYLVAVDVVAGSGPEALVRLATGIDRDWLLPTAVIVRHEMSDDGAVRAWRGERYEALTLREQPVTPDPSETERLLDAAYRKRGPTEDDRQLLARARFAGLEVTFESLVTSAVAGARSLADVSLAAHVPSDVRSALTRHAPATIPLPSGRQARLKYTDDGRVLAAVKLQDLFGVTDTPRLGPKKVPVTFELLAPNVRPVQVTSDLGSFWARVYPEIRGALKARYPKHKW
jgi:ATP-dependent RNA helicase HrpB